MARHIIKKRENSLNRDHGSVHLLDAPHARINLTYHGRRRSLFTKSFAAKPCQCTEPRTHGAIVCGSRNRTRTMSKNSKPSTGRRSGGPIVDVHTLKIVTRCGSDQDQASPRHTYRARCGASDARTDIDRSGDQARRWPNGCVAVHRHRTASGFENRVAVRKRSRSR